jgi:hypothetical protein
VLNIAFNSRNYFPCVILLKIENWPFVQKKGLRRSSNDSAATFAISSLMYEVVTVTP